MVKYCFEHGNIENAYFSTLIIITKVIGVKNYWMRQPDFFICILHQDAAVCFPNKGLDILTFILFWLRCLILSRSASILAAGPLP